ncbi:universal stress protein [Natrialbaceae archaeon AArc-T1-2]|uniref:universal stress protein n=1 Tax=Natrialbaceae archaeon AArc-T1-2 TaxID=3053904 RepID=UPI00255ACACE|nr:universal stress protein [Natrialbaceae archaeon AArc-T1-2]WIV68245.1 universal stress protein [Natrialbaceae archaeon AArc-T1-2]
MGTHGAAHPDRRVLGSVAERTIRTAPVPVVTVNEGAALASTFDTILVPTDGSDGAMAAAAHAVDIAAAVDVSVHVVHVVPSTVVDDLSGTASDLEERGRQALEAVVDVARESNVAPVEASLLTGVPHRAITDFVGSHDVDLVVMGTHGRSGVSRHFLGSVTERVLRRVDVPVVAVSEHPSGDGG